VLHALVVFKIDNGVTLLFRDGKVRFSLVLQWIFENPELDYWFGPLIMMNLGPDCWFGQKWSSSGSQVVQTMNWT
jgi:hypothetical protein